MFAADLRNRRVGKTRSYPKWRWHLDEVSAKVNDKLGYLWLAVDHESEAPVGCNHIEARQSCGAEAF
jgi:putative transposase